MTLFDDFNSGRRIKTKEAVLNWHILLSVGEVKVGNRTIYLPKNNTIDLERRGDFLYYL